MKYEPCARLTTRMTPKIRLRPLANRKSSAPYDSPLKVWMIQNSLLTARPRGPLGEPQQAGGVVAEDARLISPLGLQPVVRPDHGERVQEHGQLELLTALEDRRERRVREIAARDVGAHVDGADAGQAGRPLELADRGWRLLHWQRRTADEPVRKRG